MNQIIKRITDVTSQLIAIAEEGYNIKDLTRIWGNLPIEDSEQLTYLETAGQCILEISNMVDGRYPNLPKESRIAKKYRLMASLLQLKADQLDNYEIL